MNISGGKDMLKFFSKNKKGVSETNQAYENVGQESPAIRKLVKPIHAKAILLKLPHTFVNMGIFLCLLQRMVDGLAQNQNLN